MGSFTTLKGTPLAVAAAIGGVLCAGALIACAGGGSAGKIPRPQDTPLAYLAGRPAVVLPVQPNISYPDSSLKQPPSVTAQFLAAIDDSIAATLGERGVRNTWKFAREITAVRPRR